MSRRALSWRVGLWVVFCLLCLSPIGAMVGILAGVAVAMFGGAAGVALTAATSLFGINLDWTKTGWVLGIVVGVILAGVLAVALTRAVLAFRSNDAALARQHFATMVNTVGACVALWFSSGALARAWP